MKFIHYATFNGKHNLEKSKAFLTLYYRKIERGITEGLDIKTLAEMSQVNYHTLAIELTRWRTWDYINARPGYNAKGRPTNIYTLAKRGIHFCENRIPVDLRERLLADIRKRLGGPDNSGSIKDTFSS